MMWQIFLQSDMSEQPDNSLTERLGTVLGWLLLLMIFLSFSTVLSRYLFDVVWIAVQELAVYLHATTFMLGMVYVYHHDRHVRVDVFYQNYSARKKIKVNAFGALFLLLPFMGFMLYVCFPYVLSAWSTFEKSGETGGLPLIWLLKSLLVITPALLIIYVVFELMALKSKDKP
ncbi:MAG: TRAP transporter small permease subunit [Proteobacteria bacterium]|nr:TRAP transporter small permease subunit [Pseudomonadota bacterium]